MIHSAFHGDDSARNQALLRLADHLQRRERLSGMFQWDGARGTIAASLIDSDDPVCWEKQLGLPIWLAYAIDTVTSPLPTPRAEAAVRDILIAVAPGSDTGSVASALIVTLLDGVRSQHDTPDGLANVLDGVLGAYRDVLAGIPVDPGRWRPLRRNAITATDTLDSPRERAAGGIAEAAAWDPRRAATTPSEVLRHWLFYHGLEKNAAFGWTAADEKQIERLLTEMSERYLQPNPEDKRDVFQLLEEHHEAAATRLRAYIAHGNSYAATVAESAIMLLVTALREAA